MLLQRDVPLAPLTTLGLGGRAARMAIVGDDSDLLGALDEARGEPFLVLGGGSNVVIADAGFPGLVLRVASRGVEVAASGDHVILDVAAGEDWDHLVTRSVAEGWSGLESLAGIPGLVGATPIQNVGAYGHEVSETLVTVRVLDTLTRRFLVLPAAECGFGYRTSRFRGQSRYIVTRVCFGLEVSTASAPVRYAELARALGVPEGSRAPAREVRRAVRELRRKKGMIVDRRDPDSTSVGSFFTNAVLTREELEALEWKASRGGFLRVGDAVPRFPTGDGRFKVPAAWLVERAGYEKGYGQGRVGVSSKHALALVHRGHGSTEELVGLAREIRDGVKTRLGVTLEPEPVLVGVSL